MRRRGGGGGGVGEGEEEEGEELGGGGVEEERRRRRRSWGGRRSWRRRRRRGVGEGRKEQDRIPTWHFPALTSPIGGRVSPSCAARSCPGDQGQLLTPPPKTGGHKFQIEGS